MVEFVIEPYYEHIRVWISKAPVGSKISSWLYDRLMAFPGTKYNKSDQSWIIAKCYQHLAEIVIVTFLNKVSKKEWLAEYKSETGVKELSSVEERYLLKEHFTVLCDEEWSEYLRDSLPMGSSWRHILEKEKAGKVA